MKKLVTPTPPAAPNPLKDLDLTEGRTFGFPSARLGIPSAGFGFPSDWLGFPSAQLGIPSVRPGNGSLRPAERKSSSDRLWSPQEEAGLGVTKRPRVTHKWLKSPDSREKNRVKIVSRTCPERVPAVHFGGLTLHQLQLVLRCCPAPTPTAKGRRPRA
jgi:hypothetical protein